MTDFFLGLQNHCRWWLQHEIKRHLLLTRKSMMNPRQRIQKQRHHLAYKSPSTPSYGFSSSHAWMWELDHKEGLAVKNWWFQSVVLDKTLESPLDSKKIKQVNPKGNRSWVFTGEIDAEVLILWPPDGKSCCCCCCCVASVVSNSVRSEMAAHQAPPSLGFSRH